MMCEHEAKEYLTRALQRMKDRELPELKDGVLLFKTEDLFLELQEVCSEDQIREICVVLADKVCDCGTTDPFICGATFCDIVCANFPHPPR